MNTFIHSNILLYTLIRFLTPSLQKIYIYIFQIWQILISKICNVTLFRGRDRKYIIHTHVRNKREMFIRILFVMKFFHYKKLTK